MKLILVGPPGSGKGTQAKMVSAKLGMPQISTGDMLRNAVGRNTDLGMKAKAFMDSGRLVPDDIMLSIVDMRLHEPDCLGGYVLDGFPRTVGQAKGLEEVLARRSEAIDAVILIDIDDRAVLERLSARRVCPECQALYSLDATPKIANGVCNACGATLVLRTDDKEETVKTRLRVYRDLTLPLAQYYESRGILKKIDGKGTIEAVFASIMKTISEVKES